MATDIFDRELNDLRKIARKDSKQTHELLLKGHEALCSVPHRGGMSSEGVGDGAGISVDLSLAFFRKITGRAEELGRPMLYGTTREFLKVFGLASTDDLPDARRVDRARRPERADDHLDAERLDRLDRALDVRARPALHERLDRELHAHHRAQRIGSFRGPFRVGRRRVGGFNSPEWARRWAA